jgi:2-polyprenyl-6-methoxyphenol hydroxylase-like FAD-dependent oxidoreductase
VTLPEGGNAERLRRRPAVLVVGAGPTGLLLSSELQRRGAPCHLIDARPAPLYWDRATVVHPRSLEVFESLAAYALRGDDPRVARLRRVAGADPSFHWPLLKHGVI